MLWLKYSASDATHQQTHERAATSARDKMDLPCENDQGGGNVKVSAALVD